jgi:hypothetical protein
MIENRRELKLWLEGQRDFWLMNLATKGGAPGFMKVYGASVVLGGLTYQYQNVLGNPQPSCNDPAAREVYRDAFTVYANEQLAIYNADNPDTPDLYYEPPTGTTKIGGVDCIDTIGRIYSLE